MFLIGEALIGKEPEIAHIDLIIGEKEGVVGQAFANALSQLSAGHTPLLAIIRPNLPSKPYSLIIPKVTIKNLEQANKLFGPAQSAVAKAIADLVEEGVIPADKVDEWVIIVSVFIHPNAQDYRKIYQYNYGATKLAIKRALANYPSLDKLFYEKDRAIHPVMGFKYPRLWNPPYLQIAFDITDMNRVKKVLAEIPKSDRVIIEAGTPLIKKNGLRCIQEIREISKDAFIVADLKTLDVGQVEVDIAQEETADAVTVSGLAALETIEKFIYEAKRLGIYSYLDLMNVPDPLDVLKQLKELPDIVLVHRGIDTESVRGGSFELIKAIKENFKGKRLLVAAAGGLDVETIPEALKSGADIVVVGRVITQAKDPNRIVREILNVLGEDIDVRRVHVE
ncbi:MAG: bifunctional 5,6,7,8-tetrahydromethanopterin hydro-lyase/3-hexulose-6-phosphate synthase [Nitrososphaerales archaeon]